ncbi:MAG: SusC/RagA family TonB-linked outer membrane protein, partial [Prevotella sp.]|nr:SusC/RagA family TonB-linked outer membrane protein [Prevotella sp.]
GSDPNTMPKIRFRGESSFQGFEAIDKSGLVSDPNQPLFILDGYETTMERIIDLDMNRVESVTVLKDAAAAAIYGARAANGVIVVKTKRPKEGQLRVSYTLDLNAELPDLSSYDLLNAKENMQLIDQLKLYRNTDGTLRPEYNEIAKWVAQGVDTDWMSQPLRNSFGTRHSLNLQGGDSRMRYGLDLNYGNTPGVMKESKRENCGIGVDLSYNANDRVLFNNYLSIYKTKSKDSPYGSFASYTTINQFFPIYDQEGQMYKYYTYPNEYGSLNNWWGNVSNIPVNPLYEANVGNSSKSKTVSFNENFSFDWRILESLRLNGRISYTHSENNGDVFVSPNSATYTDYGAGLTDLTTEQQMLRGRSTHTQTEQNGIEGNMFLTYAQKFGVHFITASAGSSLSDTKSVVYGFTAQGFGDSGNSQPSFAAGYEKGGVPQNVEGHARLASFFASANYSYDDRYLFDLSYRLDGSSSFGNDKKTAPFFSTGIGWNLHNEKFIKNLKCVDIFRLRATYGEVGSVNFSPYQAKDIYSYTTNDRYDGNIGALLQGLGNRNLKWQTTKSTEFGMQLGLFQLFDLQASYYNRLTKDMVLPVTTPPSVGFGSYTENLGEMRNRGWEVSLRAFVIKKPQLNVSLFASASHNSNKIMKISTALESFNKSTNSRESGLSDYEWGQMTHRLLTRYEEGQSTTAIYAVRSLGIDPMTGNEVFLTKEGHPTLTWDANDKVVVGDAEPDVRGNFGANVGWKGLYFNLTFQYQFGGQTYNQTLVDKVENSNKYKNVDKRVLTDTWQKPGDETSFKANLTTRLVQYYTYASSRFVQDYNLLQLAAMSLQYELPKKWISPLSLESVRLSFNTSDLGYWSTVKRERGTSY